MHIRLTALHIVHMHTCLKQTKNPQNHSKASKDEKAAQQHLIISSLSLYKNQLVINIMAISRVYFSSLNGHQRYKSFIKSILSGVTSTAATPCDIDGHKRWKWRYTPVLFFNEHLMALHIVSFILLPILEGGRVEEPKKVSFLEFLTIEFFLRRYR